MIAAETAATRDFLGLRGQVAIVTGASSGIGHACALALGEAGAHVAINCLQSSQDVAASIAAEIDATGGSAMVVAADVSDEADVERMFASVVERYGTMHILINNAGIQSGAPFRDMTLSQWRKVMDVNLDGQFLCARSAVREFRRRGLQPEISAALGKIICMSSVHQRIPWAFETNYAASKGGISLLMKSLAQEVAGDRIRVNAVAPGAIRTPINREAWETPEAEKKLLDLIPYGRIGEPADIANAVLFLASDFSDYMTGSTMFVDGGMTLYPGFRGEG
ncbi:SDR family oxidoreductase [Rhizobium sp. TRM95796]|uniref:SDR family oxidoreductase n=1 Tax=Rhizobium sp. TRM95796 TaxID=2979862 RepID=UPI0021E7EA3C|nr:SDR family oxidoreductase [Rhizobium sp. TRM95796]MCV3768946.1 SDR family oxidoreductase [Rhizobium sp. TRM95796]